MATDASRPGCLPHSNRHFVISLESQRLLEVSVENIQRWRSSHSPCHDIGLRLLPIDVVSAYEFVIWTPAMRPHISSSAVTAEVPRGDRMTAVSC